MFLKLYFFVCVKRPDCNAVPSTYPLSPSVPVRVFGIAGGLACDGVLEHLSPVDLLLHRGARDEPVDDHVLVLADTEHPVHRLGICGGVPARVI